MANFGELVKFGKKIWFKSASIDSLYFTKSIEESHFWYSLEVNQFLL